MNGNSDTMLRENQIRHPPGSLGVAIRSLPPNVRRVEVRSGENSLYSKYWAAFSRNAQIISRNSKEQSKYLVRIQISHFGVFLLVLIL